jgi:hypothetical protein
MHVLYRTEEKSLVEWLWSSLGEKEQEKNIFFTPISWKKPSRLNYSLNLA